MRNSKGYVYLEMIASVSICVFLVVSILPILVESMSNRKNVVLRADAHYLLYERLSAYMDGEIGAVKEDITYQERLYELTWSAQKGGSDMVEGCVRYENAAEEYESICDVAKK
ncbi:hypothetical protein ACQKL5_01940 [Peribacillus sp. NPDC097675]|uniref:hypothetical protein n=1 Tax=Peribacillus sp. NPDC097675 TaxID=3390618 RepID=UPI003D07182E